MSPSILHASVSCSGFVIFFSCAIYTVCASKGLLHYIYRKCCVLYISVIPIIKLEVLLRWFSPAVFLQLDVLHLLSPEQKAQLMLYPETAGLNNDSISVVLSSLISSLALSGDVNPSNSSMWNAGFPVMYSPSSQDPLTQVRLIQPLHLVVRSSWWCDRLSYRLQFQFNLTHFCDFLIYKVKNK